MPLIEVQTIFLELSEKTEAVKLSEGLHLLNSKMLKKLICLMARKRLGISQRESEESTLVERLVVEIMTKMKMLTKLVHSELLVSSKKGSMLMKEVILLIKTNHLIKMNLRIRNERSLKEAKVSL